MLVYANYLKASGKNTKDAILKALGGWLKEQLGHGLHPNILITAGEYSGDRNGVASRVKVLVAQDNSQELYSWILKNGDDSVRGRQWKTEIGLKVLGDTCEVSCTVETEDASTLVLDPVQASRPRFIKYVVSNIEEAGSIHFDSTIPGIIVKKIGNKDAYRALIYDIESAQRDYPIVIVSPTQEGSYFANVEQLQQDLFGLAQVVQVELDFNSYEMEEILGRRWSAWDGAINIIQMPTSSGYIRSQVFLSNTIESWGATQHSISSKILAWVTHNTNIPRMRKRIRPEGVMRLSIVKSINEAKVRRQELDERQLLEEFEKVTSAVETQNQWVKLLEETNSNLESEVQQLRQDIDEINDELSSERQTSHALKEQLRNAGAHTVNIDAERLINMLSRSDIPEPWECLDLIEAVYGDRCVILESAKKSARDSNRFTESRQLLSLLIKLVTSYRSILLEKGDSEARKIFGKNEFAAKESETVMSNPSLKNARVFEYQGTQIEMFRHLKIGMSDDISKTIRIHFHWDHEHNYIVIGYCGKHLPISSH